jgi:general secretion pathway protein D
LRSDLWKAIVLVLAAGALSGCVAGRSFSRAERAARAGDWDMAVQYYTQAVQASPESAEYKIALERAQLAASRQHLDAAVELEGKGDLDGAIREYRKAGDYDPTNSRASAKAVQLQQALRDKMEAARPRPPVEQMKERARQSGAEPMLNPGSREPLRLKFAANAMVQDILTFIGQASGINILYDSSFQNKPSPNAIDLDGVTLEQALNVVLTTNGLFYKILNDKTILIITDSPTNHQKYDEQVVRTFYISNADVTELSTLLTAVLVGPGVSSRPGISASKTANTITVRGSAAMVAIAERVIEANDKPRAEVVIDVEILEVNRARAKQYGLNLSSYSISGVFSPEGSPTTSSSSSGSNNSSSTTDQSSSRQIGSGTVGGGSQPGKININTAHHEVLMLVPGMSDDLALAIERRREGQGRIDKAGAIASLGADESTFKQIYPYITASCNRFYVKSVGTEKASGATATIEAVISVEQNGVEIVYWSEN